MDTVYTYFLNLKEVHQNFSSSVNLKKPFSSIHYNVKDVQVNFDVDKLTESTIRVPIQIMNNTGNEVIKLLPTEVTIKYLVAMKDYETVTKKSFKVVVDYQNIKNKNKTLPVEIIRAPSEIKVLNFTPQVISYLIYK